jgi:CBS domain-containing protein
MKLKEIMTGDVEVIHPTDTLKTAAQKMRDRDIGFLPVVDGDELIGVLTDRDLVVRAMADGVKMNTIIGRELVTSPGIHAFEDDGVEEAAHLMREHQIRRLVVLNRNDGNVRGVLSLGDIAANSSSEKAGEILQVVSGSFVKAH